MLALLWSFKDDTYTLHIKNPTVEEDGTYNLVIRELDNMKTGAYVTVKAADPEYYFKKFLPPSRWSFGIFLENNKHNLTPIG